MPKYTISSSPPSSDVRRSLSGASVNASTSAGKMGPFKALKGLSPERQGQNLAVTVLCVPVSSSDARRSLSGASVNASTSAGKRWWNYSKWFNKR